jgi:AcrR family transcriptional regulator
MTATMQPQPHPKGPGRHRSVESEAAVLAATAELLLDYPLREITVEAIAKKAEVGKATIYKWWPNKAYVALDAFLASMRRAVITPDTGSAERDFIGQLRSLTRFYTSPSGKVFGQFLAEGQSDPEFKKLFNERFLQPRRQAVSIIWQRGVARGEIAADLDKEIVLDLIYGPTIFRLMAGHAPLNDAQAEAFVTTVFRGIAQIPTARSKGQEHPQMRAIGTP